MSAPLHTRKYILDTNTLIGFFIWIPIELNGNFWKKLEDSLQNGDWVLLNVIVGEIKYANDGLQQWCEAQRKRGLMKSIDDSHRNRAVEINNMYPMINEATGKSTGDVYLIAYAEANQLTILTREGYREKATDLYKIPDVCKALNIQVVRRPKEFLKSIGFNNN